MVKLIDIPFVQPLADWVWGEKDSPVCLSELPLLGVDCFSQLVTKAFGIVIILASMLNKIPIMRNMYNSQSAAGISRNSLYGESMVYANCALYGLLSGHPFTALWVDISWEENPMVLCVFYVIHSSAMAVDLFPCFFLNLWLLAILYTIHSTAEKMVSNFIVENRLLVFRFCEVATDDNY